MGIMCWCWHIIPDFSIMEYFSGKNYFTQFSKFY